jgi:flagellar motor switch protein FliN
LKTYDWIKQIPSSLLQWDDVPLLGAAPPFPWENFSSQLAESLKIESLTVNPGDTQWRSEPDYTEGIANPVTLYFQVGDVEGSIAWVMPKDDVVIIMHHLLLQDGAGHVVLEEELTNEFYRFIALETLHSIAQLEFDSSLSVHLKDDGALPVEAALSQDITIQLPHKNLSGRLLISSEFRKSWAKRYTPKTPDAYLQSPLSEKLDLQVHLETGRVSMGREQWKAIETGDFLLLDSCGLDPTTREGSVALTVNGMTLFQGAIKEGKIHIAESPQFENVERYEEVEEMTDDNPPKEEDEFVESFDSEEDFGDEDFDFDDDEFDLEEDDDDDDDDDDEEDGFGEDLDEEEESTVLEEVETPDEEAPVEEVTEAKEETPAEENATPSQEEPIVAPEESKEITSPENIPLSISVEVGSFQMSIKKLMELAPGNLLELGVRPENGVDLVFNGKCIARGELLRIGDTLGVRILEKN